MSGIKNGVEGNVENNGELLQFRGMVPESVKWPLQVQLRLRCPACDAFITADPSFAETCPCGRLKRGGTSGTVQAAGYPVSAISIWRVVPKEVLAEADTLIAVLGAMLSRATPIGDQQLINLLARSRRLLGGGDRAGARELADRLQPDIDRLFASGAVDDSRGRQAFLDLGQRALELAQGILTQE